MNAGKAFFDTNILLYLLSGDTEKADRAEALLMKGGVISVQVLNEFAAVASLDILPALKDGDSSVEGTMPRTENTECSLISPVQQAAPVAQPTGDRSAKTNAFEHDSGFTSSSSEDNRIPLVAKERTTVGGVIAIADVGSIAKRRRTSFAALSILDLKAEAFRAIRGKLGLSYPEISEILHTVRAVCAVNPLTVEIHDLGLRIAERYGFSLYDALIVAAALLAGCETLYSEDLQDRQTIEGRLQVWNPLACSGDARA